MPQALDVDRTQVRLIALQIGVREAARELGLNENTVLAWADREGWMAEAEQAKSIRLQRQERQGVQSVAIKAVETIAEYGNRTRLGLAKGLAAGADSVSQMDGQEVLMASQQVSHLVKSASVVHGWSSNHTVNVLSDVLTGALPNMDDDVIDV